MAARPNRPAVVANPSKASDPLRQRREVTDALVALGLPEPEWYDTTEQDPGGGQAAEAVARGADLVLACGGDGTVRACAAVLAGGDVPLALLPAGTGNLLARNLGIPDGLSAAAEVAVDGATVRLDVAQLGGTAFVVMGGSGFDAQLFERTSDGLKNRIGWAAYVVAGARTIRSARPVDVVLDLDGRIERHACLGVIVGNVGTLTGGLVLLPDAVPDDGQLDVALLTPRRLRDWVGLAGRIVSGQRPQPWQLVTRRGTRIGVQWPHEVPVELDGDLVAPAAELRYDVRPHALQVRVPRAEASPEPAHQSGGVADAR